MPPRRSTSAMTARSCGVRSSGGVRTANSHWKRSPAVSGMCTRPTHAACSSLAIRPLRLGITSPFALQIHDQHEGLPRVQTPAARRAVVRILLAAATVLVNPREKPHPFAVRALPAARARRGAILKATDAPTQRHGLQL